MKLVIADDEAMVRRGLRMLVELEPGLEVVGEAANGREAVQLARRARPDLVLMDIRMPELDGLSAARQVLALPQAPRVLMLTTFDEDENVYDALRIGTSGFLLKASPPEQLLEAIRLVGSGKALIDPAVTKRVIDAFSRQPPPRPPPPGIEQLTPRELEVLRLVARGLNNAEIAATLVVSEATVKTHMNRLLMKLGLRDRTQAVVLAYEAHLVRPGGG
ncbi:MAG: response regulator transcription factor [Actinomycetota bacterium]|nr:response regulator transcription factor [Actinomycetota bacterium]